MTPSRRTADSYRFQARLWLHHGEAAWHFVTLPADVADDIDARTIEPRAGFGSVPVEVTIGATTWSTSIFPDTRARSYVLPVKKPVRLAEKLDEGADVTVDLRVVPPSPKKR